ncbi:MAG: HEPN family nuclease, partial [Oscillospiraceae bacterium]
MNKSMKYACACFSKFSFIRGVIMEYTKFEKDFVERTIKIINDLYDPYENNVTLLINCLIGLISYATEQTPNDDEQFKKAYLLKLNKLGVIKEATDDEKTFRTIKNALSHMYVETHSQEHEITQICLKDKKPNSSEYHTIIEFKVEQLKDFALFVADEHLKRCEKK